ncbi:hypothetical protein T439DRAFT_359194 [Meredithblackwellia eburnea MCA 4105]
MEPETIPESIPEGKAESLVNKSSALKKIFEDIRKDCTEEATISYYFESDYKLSVEGTDYVLYMWREDSESVDNALKKYSNKDSETVMMDFIKKRWDREFAPLLQEAQSKVQAIAKDSKNSSKTHVQKGSSGRHYRARKPKATTAAASYGPEGSGSGFPTSREEAQYTATVLESQKKSRR